MDGNDLIFLTGAIVAGVSIATIPSGFVSYSDYDPSAGEGSEADTIIDSVQNVEVSASDPVSSLGSGLSLASDIITLPWQLTDLLVSFGVPESLTVGIDIMIGISIGMLVITLLLRTDIRTSR